MPVAATIDIREVTPLEGLKLAILSLDYFSDEEIKNIFLDFIITHEDEILEIAGIMREHRPRLYKELSEKYCRLMTAQ